MTKWYEMEENQLYQDHDDGLISDTELSKLLHLLNLEVQEQAIQAAEFVRESYYER